ncbi:hypothetical protein Tsubulata_016661 [Turnera subulata]|uniref:J domain-containing protein n=1 Tax=Turnera subulata TaxID=218843 RepID=A0A9Q0FNG8_9ROSI|nr:hypothetical protein Tsubulata_016661 [Turnera subulata]
MKFSQRESLLLGYNLQRPSTSHPASSPKSQYRNPEFDFTDVFGGPPRRFSFQEMRSSFGETADSKASRSEDDLPAFGDDSLNRRRHTSNDFYDDIFGGNDSLSSSPRKHERDSFSASSAARALSPGLPLPPRADLLGSSVPAQFSLPAKLIKGTDLPAFGSSGRNHHKTKDNVSNGASSYMFSPLSRLSSQAPEESGNDSSLPEAISLTGEKSPSLAQPVETDKGNNLKKNSDSSHVPEDGQFHFSIYKWASKGAPIAMSLRRGSRSRSLEQCRLQRSSSANGWPLSKGMEREMPTVTSQDAEFPSSSSSISSNAKSFENLHKDHVTVENGSAKTIFHNSREETEFSSVPGVGLSGKTAEKGSAIRKEVSKSHIKTLRSLLHDRNHEQDVKVTVKNEPKESKVKSSKKISAVFNSDENLEQQEKKMSTLSSERDEVNLQSSPINSRDSPGRNSVTGKVKDFVKIFNQETSNKPKLDVDSENHSSRWRDMSKTRTVDEPSVTTTRTNGKKDWHASNKNDKSDASVLMDEYLKQSERLRPETRTKHHEPSNVSSGLKHNSTAASAAGPQVPRASVGDANESGNFLITELTQLEDKLQENGTERDKIRDIEAQIRKWSSGKDGNIRSLLSTLQYVLWSGSGWKPVPLVDIIEGNAVKRSYQKALLCLHPDKLQQKGATADQKYIAEKVFDILQEAWTHFNSLGGV